MSGIDKIHNCKAPLIGAGVGTVAGAGIGAAAATLRKNPAFKNFVASAPQATKDFFVNSAKASAKVFNPKQASGKAALVCAAVGLVAGTITGLIVKKQHDKAEKM